jgi:hypothetical protein
MKEESTELQKLIRNTADMLYEHAKCVVIMVAFDEGDDSDQSLYSYRGGSHAAVGLADEFIQIRRLKRSVSSDDE